MQLLHGRERESDYYMHFASMALENSKIEAKYTCPTFVCLAAAVEEANERERGKSSGKSNTIHKAKLKRAK